MELHSEGNLSVTSIMMTFTKFYNTVFVTRKLIIRYEPYFQCESVPKKTGPKSGSNTGPKTELKIRPKTQLKSFESKPNLLLDLTNGPKT